MTFEEEMELVRFKRIVNVTQAREMRTHYYTIKLRSLDQAVVDGILTVEEADDTKDRERQVYEYDMAELQNALEDLTPPLPRITPEMHALYQQYAAMRFDTSDNPPYPCEYDGLEREMLYKLFALIDPERWIGKE